MFDSSKNFDFEFDIILLENMTLWTITPLLYVQLDKSTLMYFYQ